MATTAARNERWFRVPARECCYEVSDHGRVRRIASAPGTVRPCLKALRNRRGYALVKLNIGGARTRLLVHILVLEAFRGPRPPGTQTRHLNGISNDNRLVNLAWGTPKENAADCLRQGTRPLGSRRWNAKLREGDVVNILTARAAGTGIRALARRHGVHHNTIEQIFNGKAWKHV